MLKKYLIIKHNQDEIDPHEVAKALTGLGLNPVIIGQITDLDMCIVLDMLLGPQIPDTLARRIDAVKAVVPSGMSAREHTKELIRIDTAKFDAWWAEHGSSISLGFKFGARQAFMAALGWEL